MKGLKAHGHEVSFVGSCPALIDLCNKEGISSKEIKIGPPPVSKWTAISFIWRKKKMKKILDKISMDEVDVVCMLSLSEKLLFTPKDKKVIWVEHDRVGPWLTKNPFLKKLIELSKKVTTVVVSDLSRELYLKLGWDHDQIIAIPNGVDMPDHFTPQSREHLTVGCIARLTPDKGVDVLIDAVKQLPDIKLKLLGRGREQKSIRSRLDGSRMELTDFVENLDDFYSKIDLLVLPSRDHDPFGLTAAEAMLRGIPVIVTDVCGIAGYLVNGIDSIVVPAGDSEALKKAIESLSDKNLRDGIATEGKKKAEEQFSVERMVDEYENLMRLRD